MNHNYEQRSRITQNFLSSKNTLAVTNSSVIRLKDLLQTRGVMFGTKILAKYSGLVKLWILWTESITTTLLKQQNP